jgi:hypothetical protein
MLRTGKSLGLTLVAIAAHLHAPPGDDDVERSIRAETHDKYLVILCREPKFGSAKRAAENISALSGVQFSMNGRVWDPNRGLILPDVCDDPVYCGEYLPRRYNELHVITNPVGYISIEKSEAYRSSHWHPKHTLLRLKSIRVASTGSALIFFSLTPCFRQVLVSIISISRLNGFIGRYQESC